MEYTYRKVMVANERDPTYIYHGRTIESLRQMYFADSNANCPLSVHKGRYLLSTSVC